MDASRVKRFRTGLLLAFVAGCLLVSASARPKPASSGYHLLKTISLPAAPGGDEYFDYISLDPDARRVYVSHGTEVVILNADDYSVAGKIGGLSRCHGIAIAKDLGKGFISDGDGRPSATVQQVVIFDLQTLKVTGKVSTGQLDTDAIIYEPVTKHVYTFNGDSHNSTVIDPEKQAVIATIDLVGKVEYPAVDGKGMIYDNNPEKNDVVAIDARTNAIKGRWPTAQQDSQPL
jgi:DNA-binding beta-propeller fold protein YncE